jgi:hypothetical protein
MIPKTIHFIWFGKNKKSRVIKKCIKSWHKLHPDWTIKEWTEYHFLFKSCDFVKEAYRQKNWAYLSDYYRLKILYMEGGIYLDTDMLLIKPLDSLLNCNNFWGFEAEKVVSCGIIGSVKNHFFIKTIMDYYHMLETHEWNKNTIPEIVSIFYNFDPNPDIVVYPIEYFYPYPAENRLNEININYKPYITTNTIGIHLWEFSWSYFGRYQLFLRKKEFKKAMLCFIKEVFTKRRTLKPSELMKTVRIILRK